MGRKGATGEMVNFGLIFLGNENYVSLCFQEIRKDIIDSVDTDGDGFISQEEFLQLAKGRNIPGFNRRRRRAFRELLKQTVEFIVPYKYQYTVRKFFRNYNLYVWF